MGTEPFLFASYLLLLDIVIEHCPSQEDTMRTKRKKKVPWSITCSLPFVPYDSWSFEWETEVRRLIRKMGPGDDVPLLDLYDDGVGAILEEEVLVN